jgi:hypothetical protein
VVVDGVLVELDEEIDGFCVVDLIGELFADLLPPFDSSKLPLLVFVAVIVCLGFELLLPFC